MDSIPLKLVESSAILGRSEVAPADRVLVLQCWSDSISTLPERWQQIGQWRLTTFDGDEKYFAEAVTVLGKDSQALGSDLLAELPIPPVTHAAILVAANDEWTDRAGIEFRAWLGEAAEAAGDAVDKVKDLAGSAVGAAGDAIDLASWVLRYAVPLAVVAGAVVLAVIVYREVT